MNINKPVLIHTVASVGYGTQLAYVLPVSTYTTSYTACYEKHELGMDKLSKAVTQQCRGRKSQWRDLQSS